MAAVFDLARTRIGNKRDQVEDALRDRVDKFETKVGPDEGIMMIMVMIMMIMMMIMTIGGGFANFASL